MMRTFGALGGGDITTAASTITGGVAEALIATMCGLFIAVTALLPYNYLNARTEEAKHEVADASNALEILIKKSETNAPFTADLRKACEDRNLFSPLPPWPDHQEAKTPAARNAPASRSFP